MDPIAERGAPARPVELGFVEGSVTQSSASALVLGAFANVEPTGAAQAIDRILHGAISDLARRRAIGAAAGEVFVLPVGRRGLAARLVVFAGLGDFLGDVLKGVHMNLNFLMAGVVAVHAAAAVKHHIMDRDDVLRRILPA